jgi:hypothetical protein
MKSIEVQLHEALKQINTKDSEIVSLKRVIHQKQLTIANIQRDWKLKEAGLPEPCVKRIHDAFATSLDNAGLKEAINVERRKAGSL